MKNAIVHNRALKNLWIFGILLLILMMGSIPCYATQSMSGNFSGYTSSGNPASDIAAVAYAQNGRSQSSLGYTEAWCADFVSDCAKIIGQGSAVPFHGGVSGLYTNIINAGGSAVSSPQKGDIVFYNWDHVGIMIDSTNCTSGNMWSSGYSKVVTYTYTGINPGSTIRIVRPNYSNTNAKGTLNVDGVLDGRAVGNTDYYGNFHVYINGQRITTEPVSDFWHQGLNAGDTYEIKDINPDPGKVYSGGTNLSGRIVANDTQTAVIHFDTAKGTLNVDGVLDGRAVGNTDYFGNFHVYINGQRITTEPVSDFWHQGLKAGDTYEIKDINPDPGKVYSGGTNLSGTILANDTQTAVVHFDTAKAPMDVKETLIKSGMLSQTSAFVFFSVAISF